MDDSILEELKVTTSTAGGMLVLESELFLGPYVALD